MSKFIDLTGKEFGRLKVIEYAFKSEKSIFWKCICQCGNIKNIRGTDLKSGKIKSCKCLLIEKNSLKNKHRDEDVRFYKIWHNMKSRCLNKKNINYINYGYRGISISQDWIDSFDNFKRDMYTSYKEHIEKFGEKETTIDRINNNGNYEVNNCKWSSKKEQSNNQRLKKNCIYFKAISPEGKIFEEINLNKFCKKNNIRYSSAYLCIKKRYKQCKNGWKFTLLI